MVLILAYTCVKPVDVADLSAFLKMLPPVAGGTTCHDLAFPLNVRPRLGLWKLSISAKSLSSPSLTAYQTVLCLGETLWKVGALRRGLRTAQSCRLV